MKESNPKLKIDMVLEVICGVAQPCDRVGFDTRKVYVEFAQPESIRDVMISLNAEMDSSFGGRQRQTDLRDLRDGLYTLQQDIFGLDTDA